jgi:S1-C subfamily serine protease
MLWSAVSLALTLCCGQNLPQLQPDDQVAWSKIKPSVIIILQNGTPRGTAALIDAKGWFIAQRAILGSAEDLKGQFFDGEEVTLALVSTDTATHLALLRSDKSFPNRPAVVLFARKRTPIDQDHPLPLLTVLPEGPLSAELVSTSHLGLRHTSHSTFSMSEIQFELPSDKVGGAPIFTMDGKLAGILEATLPTEEVQPFKDTARAFGAAEGGAARVQSLNITPRVLGPRGMTVAYSPSPSTLRRVISGFLTPSHTVAQQAIGVFCKKANIPGALVQTVLDGSPAALGGIRPGDVIVEINGIPIRSQVIFAKVILQQEIGKTIPIVVHRGIRLLTFQVKVGM